MAVNVLDRSWRELLFQPLMHDQVAPPGFLFLEKMSISFGGNSEAAFRFFPYLLSLVSLTLFWRVSRRFLQTPALLAALSVFAISPVFVLYAGVAKQYSGDVAVVLLLIAMTLWYLEVPASTSHAAGVGIVGGVALLLSQPAVLVAAGLGALLLVGGDGGKKPVGELAAICAGWAVGAAIVTYTSLTTVSSATGQYMQQFWWQGFAPRPWLGIEELVWVPAQLAILTIWFASGIPDPRVLPEWILASAGLLLLLGAVHLMREGKRTAVIAVPVIVALIAAAIRLFPMTGRVSQFIAPSLLIVFFAGLDRIRTSLPRRLGSLRTAVLGLAILPGLTYFARKPPPIMLGGTLPVLQEVKARWTPGDRLVVSGGRWTLILLDYYGRRLGLRAWTHLDRLEGGDTGEQILRSYLQRIDAFRGVRRVWFHLEGTRACEDEAILGYLNTIGKELYSVHFRLPGVSGASAYLYGLSDPELLTRTSADGYPLPECEILTVL